MSAECVVNVSEGRDPLVIDAMAEAAGGHPARSPLRSRAPSLGPDPGRPVDASRMPPAPWSGGGGPHRPAGPCRHTPPAGRGRRGALRSGRPPTVRPVGRHRGHAVPPATASPIGRHRRSPSPASSTGRSGRSPTSAGTHSDPSDPTADPDNRTPRPEPPPPEPARCWWPTTCGSPPMKVPMAADRRGADAAQVARALAADCGVRRCAAWACRRPQEPRSAST